MAGSSILIAVFFVAGILTLETATFALVVTTMGAVLLSSRKLLLTSDGASPRIPFRSILQVHGGTLIRIAASWTDQLAIIFIVGSAGLGVYAVAGGIAAQFAVLPAALGAVGFVAASRDAADGVRRLETMLGLLAWIALIGALVVWVVGPMFFSLVFGLSFVGAGHIAAMLTINAGLAGLLFVMENYLIMRRGAKSVLSTRLMGLPTLALTLPVFWWGGSLILAAFIPISMNLVSVLVAGKRLHSSGALDFRSVLLPRIPWPQLVRQSLRRSETDPGKQPL